MRRTFPTALILSALLVGIAPDSGSLGAQERRANQQQSVKSKRSARAEARRKYREARRFRRSQVDGDVVQQRVRQLAQLRWHSSLANAKASARQQGKLVLWIHALGRIDGFL